MTEHRCDPVAVNGLITYRRVVRSVLAGMDGAITDDVIDELGDCPTCWVYLLNALATLAADKCLEKSPDARMVLELDDARVAAALARGETEMRPEGHT